MEYFVECQDDLQNALTTSRRNALEKGFLSIL